MSSHPNIGLIKELETIRAPGSRSNWGKELHTLKRSRRSFVGRQRGVCVIGGRGLSDKVRGEGRRVVNSSLKCSLSFLLEPF